MEVTSVLTTVRPYQPQVLTVLKHPYKLLWACNIAPYPPLPSCHQEELGRELDGLLEQQTQMDVRMSAFQPMLYVLPIALCL